MSLRISEKWTVERILESNPDSLAVFIHMKLNCVGCLMARFCTLKNVSNIYGIQIETLIEEINDPIKQPVPEERI